MNNKILSTKRNSAIFLSTLLVLGTIVTILPSAQAQPYYEDTYEPDSPSYSQDYEPQYTSYGKDSYKSKDSSSVSINKLKCNNNNVNINGNNTGDINVGNKGQEYLGANSYGEYYEGYDNKQEKGFDCIINNNNNNNVIVVNETTPIPPEPTRATLTVIKQITCEDETEGDCEDLLELITEDDFRFQVEGNNPDPSPTFPGSPTGTVVTLGPGDFNVTEIISEEELEDVLTFFQTHPDRALSRNSIFSEDCTFSEAIFNNGDTFLVANGTIAAGESQTCLVTNAYQIFGPFSSTPIIAQGTEDLSPAYKIFTPSISTTTLAQGTEDSSPAPGLTTSAKQQEDSVELTALEKIAKLKQQWLGLLP